MTVEASNQDGGGPPNPDRAGKIYTTPIEYVFNGNIIRTNNRTIKLLELLQRTQGATHTECVNAMKEPGDKDDINFRALDSRFQTARARLKPFEDLGFAYTVEVGGEAYKKEYKYKAVDPNASITSTDKQTDAPSTPSITKDDVPPAPLHAESTSKILSYPADHAERVSWLREQVREDTMTTDKIVLRALLGSTPTRPVFLKKILDGINQTRQEKSQLNQADFMNALANIVSNYGVKVVPIEIEVQLKDGGSKLVTRYYGELV